MKKNMTFEQAMNRLEEIARLLESGEVPLEESLKIYEEGTQLLDFCQAKLDEAEKKVLKLTRNEEGKLQTDAFEDAGSDPSQ